MASKIKNEIPDVIRELERIEKLVGDKDGLRFDPKKTRTFVRGQILHTGDTEEEEAKSAKFERDFPEEFAYWEQFRQNLEKKS